MASPLAKFFDHFLAVKCRFCFPFVFFAIKNDPQMTKKAPFYLPCKYKSRQQEKSNYSSL